MRLAWFLTGAILALAVSVAGAQSMPSSPSTPAAPGTRWAHGAPAPMPAGPPPAKVMDGPMKQVDPLEQAIAVGWLFGLLRMTLEGTEETRIAFEGAAGSLQDIREGAVVEAADEVRDGKNIAKAIEVTEAEPDRAADAPSPKAPVPSSAPLMGVPPGPDAPTPGPPKAP